MQCNDSYYGHLRKEAEAEKERRKMEKENPLSQFSTGELKAELRRRKSRSS